MYNNIPGTTAFLCYDTLNEVLKRYFTNCATVLKIDESFSRIYVQGKCFFIFKIVILNLLSTTKLYMILFNNSTFVMRKMNAY